MSSSPARKTALVTGASGGIGRALAELFAADGVDLAVVARNRHELEKLGNDWTARHAVRVYPIALDLVAPDAAQRVADVVRDRGLQLDFLVNNAGFGHFGEFRDMPLATAVEMIAVNVTALTVLTRLFLPDLVARRGRILNLASTASFQPGPLMAVYYATKAYVLSLSEALAEELRDSGVTVTALCPGPTATGFDARAAATESGLFKDRSLPTAEQVAAAGYRAMLAGRRVYIHGTRNWLMAQSVRLGPRALVTRFVKTLSMPR
jgi:short-subunit dehydrogenase